MPLFFRPITLSGKRRDSVRSHWCQVGLRRMRDRRVAEVADGRAERLRHDEGVHVVVVLIRKGQALVRLDLRRRQRERVARPSGSVDVMLSVSDGLLLLMPAAFELQPGVTPAPLSRVVTPEICQSLTSASRPAMCEQRRDVVAVVHGDVVPAIFGRRAPVAGSDGLLRRRSGRCTDRSRCSPRPWPGCRPRQPAGPCSADAAR